MTARQFKHVFFAVLIVSLSALAACTPGPPPGSSSTTDAAITPDVGVDAADTAPPQTSTITIATYNVRRLFDMVCDTHRCASQSDWEQTPTQAEYQARIDQVATAIDSLDADIVLLQEVEKQSVLDDLDAAVADKYPIDILAETNPHNATIDTAVLARGQLVDSKEYYDFQSPAGGHDRFARKFLRLDLNFSGKRVIVFSAHFISMRSDDGTWRKAEAEEAHRIVDQVAGENDGALVVMGGDLNDTPDSPTLQALTTGDGALERVAQDESISQVYTYVWGSRQQDIDHLLLAPTAGGDYVAGSAHSVNDHSPQAGLGGSDHGALVARFEMR